MSILERLSLGFRKKLPLVLQTEAAECGLACIAMVASFHGHLTDAAELRREFSISLKGADLERIIEIAARLGLGGRALRLDLEELGQLATPCILHWDFNHFVVLKRVSRGSITIHDPAQGIRKLTMQETSRSFTGVALELWPTGTFQSREAPPSIKLRELLGRVSGWWRSIGQILILSATLEVFALSSPLFTQWVIDEVLVSGDRDLLAILALGFGLMMLIQQATDAIRAWVLMHFGVSLSVQWSANVLAHLLRLPVSYFERRHLGDVVSRLGAIHVIQSTLTTAFLSAVLDGLMTIFTLALMFLYSPILALISICTMALYLLGRYVTYRPFLQASEEQIVRAAKQESHLLETIRGVKTIKLFNRQQERHAGWLTLMIEEINVGLRIQKFGLLYQQMNGLLFGIQNILIMWFGARMVMEGAFTVGVLMAFNAYRGQFSGRIGSLINKFFEVKMLRLQGERLADIVLAKPECDAVERYVPGDAAERDASIETEGLCFRYAEGEPFVLDGISMRIAAGESVAIVGPSGCGKTTLINVLLGVLEPTAGSVRIGGVEIDKLGLSRLRTLVGTVLQDDVLFAGSIVDNIAFFDPNPDIAWVTQCAKMAAVHDDIVAMPMAYNTLVGDMGSVMSGGQKQRILLARALYKRPKILVLDEATSNLDINREHEVNFAIGQLDITRLIVAHRPETIASAERMIVLTGGKIVADQATSELGFVDRGQPEQR